MKMDSSGAKKPSPLHPEFCPKGEPESVSDAGSAQADGDSDLPGKALSEFAGLGKGEKASGIQSQGKAQITSTGGPGGGYTTKQ